MRILLPGGAVGNTEEEHSRAPERKRGIEGGRADCYTERMSITVYIKNG
jgi:hypothetical protein